MQYTQEQIDRANAVSLEDFLRLQGEQLIHNFDLQYVVNRTENLNLLIS